MSKKEKQRSKLIHEYSSNKQVEIKNRETGIKIIGAVPWGTHLCQFYQTKNDLIDILVPYFKAGLENNEFCMWITSEPLKVKEAKNSLKKAVRNLDTYIKKGQIEILDSSEWYTKSGRFNADEVLAGWLKKEKQAIKKGFDGLRLTGNTFWLEKKDWKDFAEYEDTINNIIGNYKMIALCSYSLDQCSIVEILDVMSTHQFALIKYEGSWKVIESGERKKILELLQRSEEKYRFIYDSSPSFNVIIGEDGVLKDVNQTVLDALGYQKRDVLNKPAIDFVIPKQRQIMQKQFKRTFMGGYPTPVEVSLYAKDKSIHTVLFTQGQSLKQKVGGELAFIFTGIDITEQKQSEQQYETIVRTSMDGFWIMDIKGRFLDVNDTYCQLIGYTRDELLKMKISDIEAKGVSVETKQHINQVIEKGHDRFETKHQCKDGRIIDVEVSVTHSGGRDRRLVVFARDITERKQMEEELRESENRMNKSQEIAHLGSWELDLMNNRLTWSDEVYRIFGLQPQEFGATYEAFLRAVHPDDRAAVDAAYSGSLREGRDTYEIEHRIVRKDGEVRIVREKCEHIRDESGQIIRSIGMVHDITERKRTEEILHESEEKYRTIVENTTNVIMVTQPDGIISYLSPSCIDVLGYLPEDLVGTNPVIFHPDGAEKVQQALTRAMKGKKGSGFEYRILTKQGEIKWISHSWSSIFIHNTLQSVVSVISDITERKMIEEEIKKLNENLMRHSIELAAANKELEAFSYSVSHDLRAPLRSIDGFSQALLEDYHDKLDEEGIDYLRRVRNETQRMGQLIDDFLQLSRLTRVELNFEKVDLSSMAHDILIQHQRDNPSRKVKNIVEDNLSVKGDEKLLKIMFENMLGNAWKFTSKKSKATIEFGQVKNKDEKVFFIRDNGAGFDNNYADKLFIPFQRLHSDEEFDGTGIGLGIVQRIINRHGGRIWVESEVGKGATFYFTLGRDFDE
jgi:PAS domain S-box-containing protein